MDRVYVHLRHTVGYSCSTYKRNSPPRGFFSPGSLSGRNLHFHAIRRRPRGRDLQVSGGSMDRFPFPAFRGNHGRSRVRSGGESWIRVTGESPLCSGIRARGHGTASSVQHPGSHGIWEHVGLWTGITPQKSQSRGRLDWSHRSGGFTRSVQYSVIQPCSVVWSFTDSGRWVLDLQAVQEGTAYIAVSLTTQHAVDSL